MSIRLLEGDCREVLPTLPAASVHCVVTSPPYWGLRDYGVDGQIGLERTPEEYLERMVGVFREVRRVLRDDGTCWVNMGDGYATNGVAGPQRDASGGIGGGRIYGTRGKQTSRLSSAGIPHAVPPGLKQKDLIGMPWRLAFALQADGWYLRADIIWAKPNPMPESVTDRPTKAHEYVFLLTKRARYFYDADAVREPHVDYARGANGTRVGCLDEQPEPGVHTGTMNSIDRGGTPRASNPAGRNLRSVWTITPEPTPDAHFATFPRALVAPCIKAGCPMSGVVLDPFAGTGTVGRVAEDNGRDAILIELQPAYIALAREKTAQMGLFSSREAPCATRARASIV